TMLPAVNIGLAGGKKFIIGSRDLNVLFAGGIKNDFDYSYGSKIFPEAGGSVIFDFGFEKWQYNANSSALASINYDHNSNNQIDFSLLFINHTANSIEENEGYHSTNDGIIKARRYEYVNNRVLNAVLGGSHSSFTGNERLVLGWKASYSYSTNNTPDRRDLTWNYDEDNDLYYLRRENIANYRTYMKMTEHETAGRVDLTVKLGGASDDYAKGSIVTGLQLRIKTRDFLARDFFYETRYLTGVHDPENPSEYLSDNAFSSGLLSLSEGTSLSNYYLVFQSVYAGFVEFNYNISRKLLINIGLRAEYDDQSLYYRKSPERTTFSDPWIILNTASPGLYPALNMRYSLKDNTNLRLAASRTVSRPLFIELGPFVNRGMYGEHNTFGNPELTNSYNYNIDLKYEIFPNPGDLFSFTLYGKYIIDPIEKYYKASSSRLVSWMNTKDATISGFEIEFRKKISNLLTSDNFMSPLQAGINFAYLYSRIDLGDNVGINTNAVRSLQGASPYLINADLTYPVLFENGNIVFSIIYNVFGKRIYAVGTDGKDDIYELPVNTLDALITSAIGERISIKASFQNILNPNIIQNLSIDNESMIVNEYHKGMTFSLGLSYNFF
ncbi:MAG: outer membrane beta-barrel family protein, partial [Bacteroidales bacterium]|nr:outer membrane beta-barrel family protein [Bacteroidales bacterium]